MAETKIYNVSYKLTGNAQEFTNQLIALEQVAKSAAASVQGIAANMASTFATGSDRVFGSALQKAMGAHGKEMGEAFLQSVKDSAQKGANSYVSELAKKIQKNKANSIKLTPTIVENAKALVEKSIQGLGAFKIQVSPVIAAQSGVELQKQLDKIANLKVNVRASVSGVDKKTSKGYSYVPETSPSRMARNFKNLVSSSWMPTDAKGKPIMPKTTAKASQPSVNVQVRANMEGVAKQVGVGMTEIQKLVNQKSMLLPIRPLMGEAAEQISIGIGKIQDIARTKPISIPVQASIDKLNAQIKAFTPNVTIKIPPQLKTSVLNSQIKAFVPSSKIRVESKFDTAGLNSQIRAYTPSSKIKIEGKLDTAGLKSQIKAFEPKSKIKIEGKLYTAGLNAQIKAFTPSSKVRVGSSFDSSGLNSSIKAFKPKSKITLEGQLDTANIDAQIKSFKPKNKITVYAELGWGEGKSSSKSQVANLQNALKPVTLEVNANIDKALEQLRRLRATALSMSPLNIGANVSGNANKGTKNSIGGITKGSPQTALTPQNIATHIGRQLDTRIERQKSAGNDFYARTRRATYPFTGNTSFGARTPMAIEMAKGMGMMFAVSSAMQMVTNSFHQVAEYENMMKTVRAILEINDGGKNFDGRFKRMEDTIRMVGRETKFTAPEVAGAARFMAMAGLGIDDINAATSPIANLALVGDNDMSMTADKMTNIMTSFGLLKGLSSSRKKANMRHTSDVLTNTFVKSNTDLVQLAEAMQYAGPMSHLTGTALEDASAMVGIMGNAGIQSSMAGTTLRMMYQNIIKPNKKQLKEWNRLGIKRTDENGRIRDIFDILQDLRAKITGTRDLNSKIGKDQLKDMGAEVMSLFRTTAGAGTAALLENLGEAMALAKSNREADGVAERIAEEKKNTISGLWAQVTSTFTDQSVDTVSALQNTIKDMLRGLRDWLASKEAAETLKDMYDVGSSILEVFGMVAKAWRWLLSVLGGALKYFMAFQVFATQVGYLMLPFTQLISVVSSLKNGIMGLAGALGMANTASKGATGAFTRGAIANTAISSGGFAVGGGSRSNRFINMSSGKAYNRPGIEIGSVGKREYVKNVPWVLFHSKPLFMGNAMHHKLPIGMRNIAYENALALAYGVHTSQETGKIRAYEKVRRQLNLVPFNQRASYNDAINKNLESLTGKRLQKRVYEAGVLGSLIPATFGIGAMYKQNPIPLPGSHGRVLKVVSTLPKPLVANPAPFGAHSGRTASVLWDVNAITGEKKRGFVDPSKSEIYRKRAAVYNRAALAKTPMIIPGGHIHEMFSDKKRKEYLNKANQYMYMYNKANAANAPLLTSPSNLSHMVSATYLHEASNPFKINVKEAKRKAILEYAQKRHANRDMAAVSMVALARGWGLKKSGGAMKAGSALGAAFTSGIAAGTFPMPRVWLALRTGILYLVKLIGMLLSPVSLVIVALGGLSFGIYKAIDAIQVHKEELDKANKSAAEFAKRQTEMNGKFNKRASELGGFGMVNVGYSSETEDKGVGISLKENESANAVKDLKKSMASEIFNKWVKPRATNLPSELVNGFLKNNSDYINYNGGIIRDDSPLITNELSRDKAKSLALAAIWGEELIQQSWVQKAAEDLQDAIKSNDYRKKYEILKAYEVKGNMPRISSLSSDQAFEITNPEKYYEPMKAVHDFLERIAGMSSPLIQSAEAMKKIEILAKEKNIQYTNPVFQSMTRNALSAYSFKVPWISSPMQMMFDRRGMIDWATMAQRYNEKGKAFTTGQKSAILTEAYQAMAKDPNLTKIPGISDLLRTYLPLIANTRFTFRPGDTGGVHVGDQIDANEWKEPLRQWYINSGEYTGGKSFDKFFKDKKWMTDKNLGRINNWWMKHNGGGSLSSSTGAKTTPPPSASDQSAYENKYNKGAARPTQIIFNMDQLCKFDHTQVASPQQKDVAESVGRQMAIGLQQLFAQAVAEFGTIGQEGA